MTWYDVDNISSIDTPALLVYKDRVKNNIQKQISHAGNIGKLRPHVKTNKMQEICQMMLDAGIDKFKCATIAEAEMLGKIEANDVLLAYPVVGPKIVRLIQLHLKYPKTRYACLVDNIHSAKSLSDAVKDANVLLGVWIDINVGMNRTGIAPSRASALLDMVLALPNLHFMGLHVYDGHIHETDFELRRKICNEAFENVKKVIPQLEEKTGSRISIIAGGSPTYPIHAQRSDVEISPGTFVFWDWGYSKILPEQDFEFAALVATRIISIVDEHTLTTDLGNKSLAADKPLPRVYFLNAPDLIPVSQSEEHLVVWAENTNVYNIGNVLYGVPEHICPTVALYDSATVIENNLAVNQWKVIARNKRISI